MKALANALLLGGLGVLLVFPAEAQHAGRISFSGRGGAPHGFRASARDGSPRGFSGPGARLRVVSPLPAGAQLRHLPAPVRLAGRTSSPAVVIARRNFQPMPVHRHVALRGPIGQMRAVPVVQPPFFVDRRFGHFRFHHFHRGFGFPFCSPVFGFGFATHHFGFFERELACFPHPFFSPFFFPVAPIAGATFLVLPPSVVYEQAPAPGPPMEEAPAAESYQPSTEPQPGKGPAAPSKQSPRSLTLLQLKDGSMYGLTDYWIEGGQLRYLTSYGGENSVPLEQIDFDKTVQLNSERGVEFVLRPKPSTR